MDDFAQNERERNANIPRLFAPDSKPRKEDLARYADYRYEGKPPRQSGDSATVTVLVKSVKTGDPVGEVEWSMARVDKVWRLTAAPLPAK